MKVYTAIITSLIFILSCNDSNRLVINEFSTPLKEFNDTSNISFISVANYPYTVPYKMLINDSVIIMDNKEASGGYWLNIFYLDGRFHSQVLHNGRGPNENLCVSSMGWSDNKLWIFDSMKKEIVYLNYDDKIEKSIRKKVDLSGYKADRLSDSIFLFNNLFMSEHKIDVYNIYKGTTIFGIGDYNSLPNKFTKTIKSQIGAANIRIKPDKSLVAVAYRYFDLIEIYSTKGVLISAIQGPDFISGKFEVKKTTLGKTLLKLPQTKECYLSLFTTNRYIYAVYSGKRFLNEEHKRTGNISSQVFVFNWKGEPVKKLNLNHPVQNICIDKEDKYMFAISLDEGNLVRAKL